mgnify:CR=1 FL=1|tara:strand:+ start:677 stop:970 length:294 start_codon:yes stop_codon:yes gene_type:complete
MEYVIGIFTAAIFFILGRQYEKKMVERRNKRFIEEHLKNLDRLINKIKNQQTDPITGTYNIQLLESALNNAIKEERYEDASELRDLLKDLQEGDDEA